MSGGSIEEQLSGLTFGYERTGEHLRRPLREECTRCPRRVKWTCAKGHVVSAVEGSWCCKLCPTCLIEAFPLLRRQNGNRSSLSLGVFKALAEERGGQCLSTKYKRIKASLRWKCAKGHEWEASADNVRRGAWCPTCSSQNKRLTIEDMQKTAALFGGECLSENYRSSGEKLQWKCSQGHTFSMAPNNIRRNSQTRKPSWCKICAQQSRGGTKEASERLIHQN
eukprot:Plantae.Rhodophyta-Purpureofilum_apyrenoidigerum.ctg41773.p1 GENE.Plantae.Rhodophyta-Purpureofilum_apyrenoidigerum.ctg41773~~Plantae.Rhodophyta-Purpureofilum_apyrenoidigerum.ctg41773.p1  ORF type:complete len:223 (+),score=13.36 Plantae.Rhodophyta-Purpureofilum_apyrenoidigerum.ctg41773:46-714(+)